MKNTDIIILSDEVYESITFDEKPHLTLAKYPELKERTLLLVLWKIVAHHGLENRLCMRTFGSDE